MPDGRTVLIYDGDCGACTRWAMWVHRRLPATRVVAGQLIHDLAEHGLTAADVATAVYWLDSSGRPWRGARAVARVLTSIGGAWAVAGIVMDLPVLRWVSAVSYSIVAHNRHRFPGGSAACRMDSDHRPSHDQTR